MASKRTSNRKTTVMTDNLMRPNKRATKALSNDKWRIKDEESPWECPECGRKFPSSTKTDKPHKLLYPNNFMNCPGRRP